MASSVSQDAGVFAECFRETKSKIPMKGLIFKSAKIRLKLCPSGQLEMRHEQIFDGARGDQFSLCAASCRGANR